MILRLAVQTAKYPEYADGKPEIPTMPFIHTVNAPSAVIVLVSAWSAYSAVSTVPRWGGQGAGSLPEPPIVFSLFVFL